MIQPQQNPAKQKRPNRDNKGRTLDLFPLVVLLVGMTLQGAACSKSSQTPAGTSKQESSSAAKNSVKSQQSTTTAETTSQADYVYNPTGRRDPFAPIIEREEKKEQKFGIPPLERFPVTEFKLQGIVWGGFGYNAVLEGPDGKGYFVRVGTIIGQNHGKIHKITKNSFTVVESFKNYMGVEERKEITVKLQGKQEGMP